MQCKGWNGRDGWMDEFFALSLSRTKVLEGCELDGDNEQMSRQMLYKQHIHLMGIIIILQLVRVSGSKNGS